jgi:hypothetical protein
LHSWEMEFSIQYHVTINSQLNDQNSIRYYIKLHEKYICTTSMFRAKALAREVSIQ